MNSIFNKLKKFKKYEFTFLKAWKSSMFFIWDQQFCKIETIEIFTNSHAWSPDLWGDRFRVVWYGVSWYMEWRSCRSQDLQGEQIGRNWIRNSYLQIGRPSSQYRNFHMLQQRMTPFYLSLLFMEFARR